MNKENEQIAAPYGKPDIIFEKGKDGSFHIIGCLRRINKEKGPNDYRCSGNCFSENCHFREMSPEQIEKNRKANVIRAINGKSPKFYILGK